MAPENVCLIGSGNWGSAIATIVGANVLKFPDLFNPTVKMWVYEEMVDGRKLTDIINTQHENVKYLKGIPLPHNVVAVPDLLTAASGCSLLVFVVPHQFVRGICKQLKGKLPENSKAISLIKGLDKANGIQLLSDIISEMLGINVSVLMGANVAQEVAEQQFCETTIGYSDEQAGITFKKLFHTPVFRVSTVNDIAGVEVCGALKNIVALGAGFVDGLGLGANTKAAIMRIGLGEMIHFAKTFFKGVKDSTFLESCGTGDLITTCFAGRNRKVAEAFVRTGKSFPQLETEMLHGQKLQGTLTAEEVYLFLKDKNRETEFPLFCTIYRIAFEGAHPSRILHDI